MLQAWQMKMVKDGLKSAIPFSDFLRSQKRKWSPYRSNPDNDALALRQGRDLTDWLVRHEARFGTVLEIGTGWMPIIPFVLTKAGAEKIILTDVERLLDHETLAKSAEIVGLDVTAMNYDYLCPFDFREIPSHSLDIVYSRAVLEHIPPPTLVSILSECRRCLKPTGRMVHIVDNSDHWEHHDKSLSKIHFLQHQGLFWRLCNLNEQNYQNRLRHSDYGRLIQDAGFDVIDEIAEIDWEAVGAARTLRLVPPFDRYHVCDLATVTSMFMAAPAPQPAQAHPGASAYPAPVSGNQ